LAIGKAGAINAALLAIAILGNKYESIRLRYSVYRANQTQAILEAADPRGANS